MEQQKTASQCVNCYPQENVQPTRMLCVLKQNEISSLYTNYEKHVGVHTQRVSVEGGQ